MSISTAKKSTHQDGKRSRVLQQEEPGQNYNCPRERLSFNTKRAIRRRMPRPRIPPFRACACYARELIHQQPSGPFDHVMSLVHSPSRAVNSVGRPQWRRRFIRNGPLSQGNDAGSSSYEGTCGGCQLWWGSHDPGSFTTTSCTIRHASPSTRRATLLLTISTATGRPQ